jgi:LacI family transcriptional regulator
MLTGRPDLLSARLREQGFRQAMAAAGAAVDEGLVRLGSYDPGLAAEQAERLLAGPERPTAVFAANDLSAIATIDVARRIGLRVPRDVSVVGFDDIPEATRCSPMLTTVEQPIREMGRRAVELLIGLVRGEAEPDPAHIMLPTRLVVRNSTRAIDTGR